MVEGVPPLLACLAACPCANIPGMQCCLGGYSIRRPLNGRIIDWNVCSGTPGQAGVHPELLPGHQQPAARASAAGRGQGYALRCAFAIHFPDDTLQLRGQMLNNKGLWRMADRRG